MININKKKIKSNYQHLKINARAQDLGIALKWGKRDKESRKQMTTYPMIVGN